MIKEEINDNVETVEVDPHTGEKTEDRDLTYEDKQTYLVKFGYDPTNVKYMNSDILDQAYASALRIRQAQGIDNW